MIKIERTGLPPSLDLENPESAGSKERKKVLDHLLAHGELPASVQYEAYRREDVKDLLKAIFGRKCAYCESFATAGNDGDIEHYRPKKGVTEADEAGKPHPGYWWLAMRWSNLLLSCQHCNQYRGHVQLTGAESEEEIATILEAGREVTLGKKNRFPTSNGFWVTRYEDDEADEHPLLLNPCETDPEDLFEWDFERSLSTVKARNGDARATTSIDIYGLNRRDLTEARVTVLNRLRWRRQTIRDRLARFKNADSDARASELLDDLIRDLQDLRAENCGQEAPYAALSRAFCNQLEEEVLGSST